jgi:hypothetical protein
MPEEVRLNREEKLAVFRALFDGRQNAYAVGRIPKGSSRHVFFTDRTRGETAADIPLSDDVLTAHLTGKRLIAQYSIRDDGETVSYFAIDFDDHDGTRDPVPDTLTALAYLRDATSWPIYIERSKSGTGFHLWGFFSAPVPAWRVRRLLFKLVMESGVIPKEAKHEAAYDRIFPVQDNLNGKKGYGNCICLPLNGKYLPENSAFIDPETMEPYGDQWGFLSGIERIDPLSLDDLVAEHGVMPPGKEAFEKNDEPFEGPEIGKRSGLLRVLDNCDFISHCKDNASTLKEPLWYALACNLAPFAGGKDAFHELSKKHPGYDELGADAKFANASASLSSVGPQTCGFIATIGFPCARNCLSKHGYKSPASWGRKPPANLRDVVNGIDSVDFTDDMSTKISLARGFLKQIDELAPLEQTAALRALATKSGFKLGELKDELTALGRDRYKDDLAEGSGPVDPDTPLYQRLKAYLISRRKDDPFDVWIYTRTARDWFQANGGLFYSSQSGRYLFFQQRLYEIGPNPEFDALMLRVARSTRDIPQHRCLWSGLAAVALESGTRFGELSWSSWDWASGRYFYNLNDPDLQIIEVSSEGVRVMPNGGNDKKVLLGASEKIEPVVFNPDVDLNVLRRLKTDIVDNLTCDEADAYIFLGWGLAMFLMECSTRRPLMKLSGGENSGKTSAARLLSTLLYGTDVGKTASVAANFTDGARNPFMSLDNVEARSINDELLQFLLLVATGGTREKRQRGTDTGLVQERLNCIVALTAIEGFEHSELVSRTYEADFSASRKRDGYVESDIVSRLTHYRDDIISALLIMFSKEVLPNLGSVKRGQVIRQSGILRSKKDRTADYFSLMLVILEALWPYIASSNHRDVWPLIEKWVGVQDTAAAVTTTETESYVYFLNALHNVARTKDNNKESFESRFGLKHKFEDDGTFWIESTAADLLAAFDRICRELGRRNPYLNTHRLDRRLRNGEPILAAAGWTREKVGMRTGTQWWRYSKLPIAPGSDDRQEALFGSKRPEPPPHEDIEYDPSFF